MRREIDIEREATFQNGLNELKNIMIEIDGIIKGRSFIIILLGSVLNIFQKAAQCQMTSLIYALIYE